MIIMKMTMIALPDKREEVKLTLIAMIETMHKVKECRNFEVFRNIPEKDTFSSFAEWGTRSALNQYLKSDNFSVILGMNCLLGTPMQLRILTISRSEGNEFIKAYRSQHIPMPAPSSIPSGI
ncbi:antibiotic biosynthesis monooxygenase [bacterium]|nr:antibiotic biosynthesis monooxygenase [candidate division CSSED10-310 bacterium]